MMRSAHDFSLDRGSALLWEASPCFANAVVSFLALQNANAETQSASKRFSPTKKRRKETVKMNARQWISAEKAEGIDGKPASQNDAPQVRRSRPCIELHGAGECVCTSRQFLQHPESKPRLAQKRIRMIRRQGSAQANADNQLLFERSTDTCSASTCWYL